MRYLIVYILLLLMVVSCAATTKTVYVPVQGENKIVYRDSTIYLRDTIYVPLPQEEKEIVTHRDSSHLETSVAVSDAWVGEDNKLNHTLRNKKTSIPAKRDTVFTIEYVDRINTQVVVEEVKVDVPYIPNWVWWICGYALISAVWTIAKIFWKYIKKV